MTVLFKMPSAQELSVRSGVAELEEGLADGAALLGIVERSSNFAFCCGGHHVADDVADDEDWAVDKRV